MLQASLVVCMTGRAEGPVSSSLVQVCLLKFLLLKLIKKNTEGVGRHRRRQQKHMVSGSESIRSVCKGEWCSLNAVKDRGPGRRWADQVGKHIGSLYSLTPSQATETRPWGAGRRVKWERNHRAKKTLPGEH